MSNPIYVTRPSLAPLDEYVPYLQEIWRTGIMTHNGPLVQQLENDLCSLLDVKHVVCVANGTVAIQLALRALDVSGEIITTPFSFVATSAAVNWERCAPVFVDIEEGSWNLNPLRVEQAITPDSAAILPVHVFSRPCNVDEISRVADKYGLKVIYDAAHAMSVVASGRSLLRCGDVSAISFHATKLFNTAEGGACITDDDSLAEKLRRMRFFGFDDSKNVVSLGLNAKMTELNAALGIVNLKHLDRFKANRKAKYKLYRDLLSQVSFVSFQDYVDEEYNFSYMPVLFKDETILLRVLNRLALKNIHAKRYFHPSLSNTPMYQTDDQLPVAEHVSRCIACLPLYDTLSDGDIERICNYITAL